MNGKRQKYSTIIQAQTMITQNSCMYRFCGDGASIFDYAEGRMEWSLGRSVGSCFQSHFYLLFYFELNTPF